MNIQIFGTKKCNDTKKAERFFKERGIKFQFIDMKEKGMSKGEFNSVAQANGGLENMINWEGKDKDLLALIKYIAEEDKFEKVLVYSIRITVNSIRNDGTTRKDPGNGGKPRKIKGFSELMKRGGARIDKFFEKRAHFSEQKEKLSTLSTKRAGKLHKQRVPGSFLNWNE